jgi:hypothetical protein
MLSHRPIINLLAMLLFTLVVAWRGDDLGAFAWRASDLYPYWTKSSDVPLQLLEHKRRFTCATGLARVSKGAGMAQTCPKGGRFAAVRRSPGADLAGANNHRTTAHDAGDEA